MTVDAPRPHGGEEVVRALVVLLAVAVASVVVWKVFDHVAAPAMFRVRQDHLASDYGAQRAGLEPGQAAGILQIPGIGANLVVVEGTTPSLLRGGPGHRVGTPLPGEEGNVVIEGHRTRWGGPFHDLARLVPRTRIVAADRSQVPVEYRVTTVRKHVSRDDLARFLAPSKDLRITLVTHAGDAGDAGSDERVVVQAVAGTPAKAPSKKADTSKAAIALDPSSGSPTRPIAAALVALGLAVAAVLRLRRDHGRLALCVVVVPLALAVVVGLLMGVDEGLSGLL